MRSLSAEGLIEVWERGAHRPLPDRADAGLFAVRDRSLGPDLRGRTECPVCNSRLEFTLPIRDVYTPEGEAPPPLEGTLAHDGWSVRYRLLTAGDLVAATAGNRRDVASVRFELLRRAILEASLEGEPVPAHEVLDRMPEALVEALGERMMADDPQAEVELRLTCARCGHGWSSYLDICHFFWTETAAQSERLLGEVHTLARAYGWPQSEILAMSPARRQAYLERLSE